MGFELCISRTVLKGVSTVPTGGIAYRTKVRKKMVPHMWKCLPLARDGWRWPSSPYTQPNILPHTYAECRVLQSSLLYWFTINSEMINLFRHDVGLLERWIDPSQGLYLQRSTKINAKAVLEPMITVLELPKTVRTLPRAATGTGVNIELIPWSQ